MAESPVRIIFGIFAILFVAAAVLQFNDPEPILWIGIYGVAFGFSASGAAGRPPPRLALVGYGAVCIGYAALLAYQIGVGDVSAMYETVEGSPSLWQTAEGRELGGLAIAIAVTAWLYRYRGHLQESDSHEDETQK